MIGHISGEVLFSDGSEAIVRTNSGIGYQVYCFAVLAEGRSASLYISHVIRETSEELYGFRTIREKKLFEMLTSVKGVGPKSAYTLLASLGVSQIIEAITLESKKTLTKAPGIGPKAAAQMILDLANKIHKVKIYSQKAAPLITEPLADMPLTEIAEVELPLETNNEVFTDHSLLNDALMACKELGFKEDKVIPLAQKILVENAITKPEQLVHLVLKEM